MPPNTALTRYKEANDLRAKQALEDNRHTELLGVGIATQDTILQVAKSFVEYLDNHTSKTEVVNQLTHIGTPDAFEVVKAVNELDDTLKSRPVTDLSEIASLLKGLLTQAEAIPKEQQTIEIPKSVEVNNQKDYSKDFKSLETAVKAIKMVAEAPVVNYDAPDVHVDAPDLKPLTKDITDAFGKAIGKIKYPVIPKVDLTKLEKEAKTHTSLLKDLRDIMPGGGGSGGGSIPSFIENGVPTRPELLNGAVPVTSPIQTERYDYSSSTIIYTAVASLGTAVSSLGWTITKYDLSDSSDANGTIATDVSWDDRATGTYS